MDFFPHPRESTYSFLWDSCLHVFFFLELPQSAWGAVIASTGVQGGFRCPSHICHKHSSLSGSNSQLQWDIVLELPPFLAACTVPSFLF